MSFEQSKCFAFIISRQHDQNRNKFTRWLLLDQFKTVISKSIVQSLQLLTRKFIVRVDLSCQIKDIDFKFALLMVIFDHPKQKMLISRE